LRALLPLFAAIDREAGRALVAINRWSVVDRICARGTRRDEVVAVTSQARGETDQPAQRVAREHVRAQCLDAEDGRDGNVDIHYVRYDTALHSAVEITDDDALRYEYDDGPGMFSGDARKRFLDWVSAVPQWSGSRPRAQSAAEPAREPEPEAYDRPPIYEPAPVGDVWARPR
jgi:hypothetical protein